MKNYTAKCYGNLAANDQIDGRFVFMKTFETQSTPSPELLLFSNTFYSAETTWPIKAKHYMEPLSERRRGGGKHYMNGPGHMTARVATPIYGKNV